MKDLAGVCLLAPDQCTVYKGFSGTLVLILGRRHPLSQILLAPVTLKQGPLGEEQTVRPTRSQKEEGVGSGEKWVSPPAPG